MTDNIIRAATPGDLPAIVALWGALQETNARFDPRLTPTANAGGWYVDFLRGQIGNASAAVFVAVQTPPELGVGGLSEEHVIGYTFGQIMQRPTLESGDCGYIADLCVHEKMRGQGIGRQLYTRLRAWFAACGIHAIEVQIVRANPASQAFWRKMGFGDFLRTLRSEIVEVEHR